MYAQRGQGGMPAPKDRAADLKDRLSLTDSQTTLITKIFTESQEAMRKALTDPAFIKEYKKLTGDDPTPLTPEANEKAVREIPREPDIIGLFKKIAGPDLLPGR